MKTVASAFFLLPGLAIAVLGILSGCGFNLEGGKASSRGQELILFSRIGDRVFSDHVMAISPDGSDIRSVFAPAQGRSFFFASANSLSGPAVVLVHELSADRHSTVNHLWIYDTGARRRQRLLDMAGLESAGVLSPDNSKVIFSYSEVVQGHPLAGDLWLFDLESRKAKRLTTGAGVRDDFPCWGPGDRILFIRMDRTVAGLLTHLMAISESGGTPQLVLGPEEGVAAVSCSPTASHVALWTRNGVEILHLANGVRTVLVPRDTAGKHRFLNGGIALSKTGQRIAYALFNTQDKQHEIWTVMVDGTGAKPIYATREGRLTVSSFVQASPPSFWRWVSRMGHL